MISYYCLEICNQLVTYSFLSFRVEGDPKILPTFGQTKNCLCPFRVLALKHLPLGQFLYVKKKHFVKVYLNEFPTMDRGSTKSQASKSHTYMQSGTLAF